MLRLDDMHRLGGYSSTAKSATIPAATFQTPVRFGTPDPPTHNSSPYPIVNQQLSNPPSPGPARAYSNRSATLSYPVPQPIDPIFPHIEDATPLITSPHRPPSFDPGVYEIKNDVLGVSVDFNEMDRKSVVGYQYHGNGNQQWEFAPLGKGWSIKSVSSGLYLTIEKGIGPGVPIVASEYPAAWNVQIEHDDPGLVRISWPGSESVWDLRDGRGGTPVQLGNRYPQDHPDCKLWRVTFLRTLPQAGLDSRPAMPKAHPHKKRSWSDDWSSDSDSDGSYTIVKTITKTKKVSSKRRGGRR